MSYLNNMNFSSGVPVYYGSDAAMAAETPPQYLEEAEQLVQSIKKFNIHHEATLESHGVTDQALAIERWLESYRRGQTAARKLSENGLEMLEEMSKRLHEAVAEMQRYEGEGGNPATKSQQAEIDNLTHAMKKVEQLSKQIHDASFVQTPSNMNGNANETNK